MEGKNDITPVYFEVSIQFNQPISFESTSEEEMLYEENSEEETLNEE